MSCLDKRMQTYIDVPSKLFVNHTTRALAPQVKVTSFLRALTHTEQRPRVLMSYRATEKLAQLSIYIPLVPFQLDDSKIQNTRI